jgi:hypothetical protein
MQSSGAVVPGHFFTAANGLVEIVFARGEATSFVVCPFV